MDFAIVGCGFIAKKHAKAIENVADAKLVAVSDKIPEAMTPYVEEYGVTPYTELDEMLQEKDIDVVCICTPSGLHAPLAVRIAAAKKHIILEKPIAMTLEDTDRIIDACNENGVKLSVVHPNRFRPVVQELRKILDQGLLGKISHANATVNWNRNQEYYDQAPWRGTKEHDGGVLMNQAIHNIDLLLWFMGKPFQVFSMEATRLRHIEAEDVSTGLIQFETGALCTVETSTTVYPKNFEESITLFGEKGTVKIGGSNALFFEHLEIEGMSDKKVAALKEKIKKDPWGTPGHQWIIEDMVHSIKEDKKPAVTGEDGRKALELVLSFYESAKNNKPFQYSKERAYANN
ncbi:Gfo/Idh/MocA family oxidoreductase [Virgibacillus halodenitrificans]|uniref:Gfo/Idh/MocA family protein n=1 Tax=Virgibacillus halodenitrificans TaxID=1482 RepID=UPI0024C0CC0E|nr:Gfo/Idh/MocA family oxidoreductase [Virgibacillus halodenitrificans]WHX26166.1 Gfo/Idh/MocA family oxidoreductase [Virgibacillus halodenitrificans]